MANWVWPCPGNSRITSGVGPRWGKKHKGIDIGANKGQQIVASRAGKVTSMTNTCTHNYSKSESCGCGGGYGNCVYIDHLDGYVTRYGHMTDVYVKVGDRVEQGQVIGTVGSTGFSTGNHLHFEIRKGSGTGGDQYLDPEEYVSPDNTIIPKEVNTTVNTENSQQYVSSSPISYAEVTTMIERSTKIISNRPLHPYIRVYLGDDYELVSSTGKPQMIQRLEMNRMINGAGFKGSIVLFDDDWDTLEYHLAKYWNNVRIQYGYAETSIHSPEYLVYLQSYSIDFMNTGTLLTIELMSQSAYENLTNVSIETNTSNPTEAVKAICRAQGYYVNDDNFDATEDVEGRVYNSDSEYFGDYITNVIIPESIAKNDEQSTMSFWVDTEVDENGNTIQVAHFKAISYDKAVTLVSNDNIKTYSYQKGYDSVVKELYFDIKGVFGGTTNFSILPVATGLSASGFGIEDKREYKSSVNQEDASHTMTGQYSWTRSLQSIPKYATAGESSGQVSAKLNYYVKNSIVNQYEATMTILGDPTIQMLDYVRILNVNDAGYLHHTSGVYQVMSTTDVIESGTYLTTLKLRCSGTLEGVEIRNPKRIVK